MIPTTDEQRAIAEAATPGPWKATHSVDGDQFAIYPDTGHMEFPVAVKPQFVRGDIWEANARHIATFDPPAVLTLLDRIAALRTDGGQDVGRVIGRAIKLLETTPISDFVNKNAGRPNWEQARDELFETLDQLRAIEAGKPWEGVT